MGVQLSLSLELKWAEIYQVHCCAWRQFGSATRVESIGTVSVPQGPCCCEIASGSLVQVNWCVTRDLRDRRSNSNDGGAQHLSDT